MLRKHWVLGVLTVQVMVFLLLISLFLREPAATAAPADAPEAAPVEAPQAQIATHGQYVWSYSIKYVCGLQRPDQAGALPPGEPVVKPANYATEINIYNYNFKDTFLRKRFIVLVNGQQIVREPERVGPSGVLTHTLEAGRATMDDCNNLWRYATNNAPLPTPLPVFIGYLVIVSPLELDIDAVYTANTPGALNVEPNGVSIDVERVMGKRVFVPFGALPN